MRFVRALLLAGGILAGSMGFAQSVSFTRTFPVTAPGRLDFQAIEVNYLADHTYVVGSFEDRNLYVLRLDRFGNIVATRIIDFNTQITPGSHFATASLDNLGNLYVGSSLLAGGTTQNFLTKLNPSLQTVFSVAILNLTTVRHVIPAADGSFVGVLGPIGTQSTQLQFSLLDSTGAPITNTNIPCSGNSAAVRTGALAVVATQDVTAVRLTSIDLQNGSAIKATSLTNSVLGELVAINDSSFALATSTSPNVTLSRRNSTTHAIVAGPTSEGNVNFSSLTERAGKLMMVTSAKVLEYNAALSQVASAVHSNNTNFAQARVASTGNFSANPTNVFALNASNGVIGTSPLFTGSGLAFKVDRFDNLLSVGEVGNLNIPDVGLIEFYSHPGASRFQTQVSQVGPVKNLVGTALTTPEGDVIAVTDRDRVARISRAGTTLWTSILHPQRDMRGLSARTLTRLSTGGIIVQSAFPTGGAFELARLNQTTGTIEWRATPNSETSATVTSIVPDLVGDFYVLSREVGLFGSFDNVVRKIRGSDGTILWKRLYDALVNGTNDNPVRMTRLSNGNLFSVGNASGAPALGFCFTVDPNGNLVMSRLLQNATDQFVRAVDVAPDGIASILVNRAGGGRLIRINPNTGADTNGPNGVPCSATAVEAMQSTAGSNPVLTGVNTVRLVNRNSGADIFALTPQSDKSFVPKVAFDSVGAIYTVQTSTLESDDFVVNRWSSVGALLRTALFTPTGNLRNSLALDFVQGKELDLFILGQVDEQDKGRPAILTKFGTPLAPVVRNDMFTTARNTPLGVSLPGVLLNDTDPNGNAMTATKVTSPPPQQGTVSPFNSNGSFTFTPAANFSGTTSFTYRATDSTGLNSEPAKVTITVTP